MGMGWTIECGYPRCLQPSWASNIVELIGNFCDGDGLLVCPHCKKPSGYIRKEFNLQEEGETWEPILRGVIRLGNEGDTYQPFVFLASYQPDEEKGKPASHHFQNERARTNRGITVQGAKYLRLLQNAKQ